MLKKIAAALCCAFLFVVLPASADQWNKKTVVTFSNPVELPGIVLPAGTYVFRLLDSLSDRHIVQVFNADETKIFTTILAIPNYRLTPSAETVLRFDERPRHLPEALRAWFYPGDNFGQEFVYPKTRALQLAETAREPVLSTEQKPLATPEELKIAAVLEIAPPKREIEPIIEMPARTATGEADRTTPVPELVSAPIPEEPAKQLPKTASPLPLIALVGVVSLGAARLFKTRR
jgi:hypothetical protein